MYDRWPVDILIHRFIFRLWKYIKCTLNNSKYVLMPYVAYIKMYCYELWWLFQIILMYSLYNIMAIKSIIILACFTA